MPCKHQENAARRARRAFCATLVYSAWASTMLAAEPVPLTTLEWPPYTGSALPGQGATSEVARQAFAAVNLEVKIAVQPWQRAIATAARGLDSVAYFPGYHCEHRSGFIPSAPVGRGPLGFAQRERAPIRWARIEDLARPDALIGIVRGYANTVAFDSAVAAGEIRVSRAPDDLTNLKLLLHGRVDAVVIDGLVLRYLVATSPELDGAVDQLGLNERLLAEKALHVCFRDDASGRQLRDRFDAGLAVTDADEIVERYVRALSR